MHSTTWCFGSAWSRLVSEGVAQHGGLDGTENLNLASVSSTDYEEENDNKMNPYYRNCCKGRIM